jgi:hypothetical protein
VTECLVAAFSKSFSFSKLSLKRICIALPYKSRVIGTYRTEKRFFLLHNPFYSVIRIRKHSTNIMARLKPRQKAAKAILGASGKFTSACARASMNSLLPELVNLLVGEDVDEDMLDISVDHEPQGRW